MQYLTTETTNMPQFWAMHQAGKLNWQPTKAKSEASAKSVAQKNRMFQCTIPHVAFITGDCKIVPVCSGLNGHWISHN